MSETPEEAAVRRYWREVWSEGHLDHALEFYADEYFENGQRTSPEEFSDGAAAWLAHFTGFRADVDDVFSSGHRVISRVTYRGTHTGDFKRVPARGQAFEQPGIDIFECEAGRVVHHWHSTDHLAFFQQLGAALTPAEDPPD